MSWAVRPNEPSGFRGRKDLLKEGPRFDTASALLSLQKLWFVDTVL